MPGGDDSAVVVHWCAVRDMPESCELGGTAWVWTCCRDDGAERAEAHHDTGVQRHNQRGWLSCADRQIDRWAGWRQDPLARSCMHLIPIPALRGCMCARAHVSTCTTERE